MKNTFGRQTPVPQSPGAVRFGYKPEAERLSKGVRPGDKPLTLHGKQWLGCLSTLAIAREINLARIVSQLVIDYSLDLVTVGSAPVVGFDLCTANFATD